MGNIKDIFKIILVMQLLAFTFATYGHPDAETIDFGSPSQPSRDHLIIDAAIKRGMDGDAVAELLRTKKPVVRTTTTPAGFTKTTTYKLEPDGSISSKSILQKRHRYVYNSDNIPDDLKNAPTGTVTRTFTDSDGNKVTQTIAINQEKPSTTVDTDDLSGDWFSKPFPSWPEETPASPPIRTSHRTITRTFTEPNGERRTSVQTWPTDTEYSKPASPTHYSPPSFSRTYTTSHNQESPAAASKPNFPSLGNTNWPTFDQPAFPHPWDATNPEDDLDGWEVVQDPETTTKKHFESWTPKTWNWPEFPTHPTTTTTAKPKLYIEPEPTSRKPLPSLDDFLKSQYSPPTNRDVTTSTTRTTTSTTKTESITTPKAANTTPKFIKIEDLPVVEVLHNGKPADENFLKSLPPHLTPRTTTEKVLKIEHKRPIEEDIEIYTPKVETNVRTFSKTHLGPEKPTLSDLDPQMQEVLKRAGISPADITHINGDTITKVRKEPDGRIITTTYKVNSVPVPPVDHTPIMQHYVPPTQLSSHSYNSYKPHLSSLTPLATLTPHISPISEFLAKLGLTKFDITSRNGHYAKTLIDDNGDVLTATFVLSSPKNARSEELAKAKPQK